MTIAFVRPVRASDFDDIMALARQSGGGMTNLPNNADALKARIDHAVASFAIGATEPGPEVYLMALEREGRVIGTTAVFAAVGLKQGFINYKLIDEFHQSNEFGLSTRRSVLMPTHDFTGCAEVGSLFVSPEARGGGHGKLLARSRYLFIAQKPEIIADHVCAELRGWRAPDGAQPFWESLGRHFFEMGFEEADLHNAAFGNQFIQDLMPRHPVYTVFLSEAARASIGRPHDSARAAYDMLLAEGFEFDNYIDIFDAGPLVDAKTSQIRTIRKSQIKPARIGAADGAPRMLLAAGAVSDFRCCAAPARVGEDHIVISSEAAAVLSIRDADPVRFVL